MRFTKGRTAACLLLSLFGLAGCDVQDGLEGIANQATRSVELVPTRLVIWPGTLVSAGSKKVNVFGQDRCQENSARIRAGSEDLSSACIVIKPETKSVDVLYRPLAGSRSTFQALIKETWSVERDGDAVILKTASGEPISPASLSGSAIPGVQFRAYEGS